LNAPEIQANTKRGYMLSLSDFLAICSDRYSIRASEAAQKIISIASQLEYKIEFSTTPNERDARAKIAVDGYGIFGIFAMGSTTTKDVIFVIRDTPDFENNQRDVAAAFVPFWIKASYRVEEFKYGVIPLSRKDAVERGCYALGAYAALCQGN